MGERTRTPDGDNTLPAPVQPSGRGIGYGVVTFAVGHACGPADDQRDAVEPARVQAITIAGKVCRIQIPPSSCKLIENVLFSSRAKPSAPTFISSEASRATRVSSAGGGVGTEELLVDGAGKQVGCGNRHDGRRVRLLPVLELQGQPSPYARGEKGARTPRRSRWRQPVMTTTLQLGRLQMRAPPRPEYGKLSYAGA